MVLNEKVSVIRIYISRRSAYRPYLRKDLVVLHIERPVIADSFERRIETFEFVLRHGSIDSVTGVEL